MDKPLPTIDGPASLDNAFALLSGGAPALVVVDEGRAAGVVTKLDLLEYLAHRARPRDGRGSLRFAPRARARVDVRAVHGGATGR